MCGDSLHALRLIVLWCVIVAAVTIITDERAASGSSKMTVMFSVHSVHSPCFYMPLSHTSTLPDSWHENPRRSARRESREVKMALRREWSE